MASNFEKIMLSIIVGADYDEEPKSRMEELLIELKTLIGGLSGADEDTIKGIVENYLNEHGVTITTDNTLSIEGTPADAKAVGDALVDYVKKDEISNDADTLDGLHASAFVNKTKTRISALTDITQTGIYQADWGNSYMPTRELYMIWAMLEGNTMALMATETTGTNHDSYVCTRQAQTADDGTKTYYFTDWKKITNTDADTLDGKHADDFLSAQGGRIESEDGESSIIINGFGLTGNNVDYCDIDGFNSVKANTLKGTEILLGDENLKNVFVKRDEITADADKVVYSTESESTFSFNPANLIDVPGEPFYHKMAITGESTLGTTCILFMGYMSFSKSGDNVYTSITPLYTSDDITIDKCDDRDDGSERGYNVSFRGSYTKVALKLTKE